ncbi:MAG: zinc ribbon domain-containing protein [Bacilli bacterium]|nr:zinc ribbon domain-containing protein [Bacilli bacterium]MBN2877683.1 zinc ribbon domain-containing protein [Bacilli bacterium]
MKRGLKAGIFGIIVFLFVFGVLFAVSPNIGVVSAIAGIFLFVMIFIIGVLALIRSIQSQQQNSPYSSNKNYEGTNNFKPCVKCKQLIDLDYEYCPKCGASQKNTIICEYCGHENPAGNALCENCNGFL